MVPDDAAILENCERNFKVVGYMSLDQIKIKESIEEKGRGYIGPIYTTENIRMSASRDDLFLLIMRLNSSVDIDDFHTKNPIYKNLDTNLLTSKSANVKKSSFFGFSHTNSQKPVHSTHFHCVRSQQPVRS